MKWIELNKKFPKVCETVLICTNQGRVCSGYLAHRRPYNIWVLHDQELSDELVIAWSPLPQPLIHTRGIECLQIEKQLNEGKGN